jgi:actin-related protein 4
VLTCAADEISALVLDPGTAWTRAGFAGEDTPKSVIPTDYGVIEGAGENGAKKYYVGDNDVHAIRPGMEIRNFMSDGIGMALTCLCIMAMVC